METDEKKFNQIAKDNTRRQIINTILDEIAPLPIHKKLYINGLLYALQVRIVKEAYENVISSLKVK